MARGASARLFVALDLPAPVRGELVRWGRAAALSTRAAGARLRVLEPEALHVTLCFLGERPAGEIGALGDALGAACATSPPVGALALGAPLWLPPRRPRALAVELRDDAAGALAALRGELVRALAAVCDFEVGRRRFQPHVTVARLRPREAPGERGLPATPALTFAPASATLYRSWLTPSGATYEGLASHGLAAGGV
jgi:RNA 2',3'-cyclic 3'-phosphodiesterase